jgi:histone acetyltransferase MYST1
VAALELKHKEQTRVRNIEKVYFGDYEIDTWYYSPYPEDYGHMSALYVCDQCLKYMKKRKTWEQHCREPIIDEKHCTYSKPPGKLIYYDYQGSVTMDEAGEKVTKALAVYEIDGKEAKLYCQNLCLLGKLFLDHKTLYFDVSPFLFYVVAEVTGAVKHELVGYFSKEREMTNDFNLACIMVMPPYQRRGYGKFLIALSYALSPRGRKGTPEKPLSDMGKVGYKSYWTDIIVTELDHIKKSSVAGIYQPEGGSAALDWSSLSVRELSDLTHLQEEDIE